MTSEEWRRIEELYFEVHEHGLVALANVDVDLRRAVERMLAQDGEGKILDRPATDLLPEPESVSIGSRIGPYLIGGILGAGGMGEVYWAQDTTLKRRVALKVLPNAFARDPERLARFQREAELLAQLDHPNIARIYGAEENALVMELVEGKSPKGPLPFDEAWRIASQLGEALEYAHEKGVIHRDLKPANVKVTADGVVKLLDFGLATAPADQWMVASPEGAPDPSPTATGVGVILGTAAYMSPEQAKGKRLDRRTDIWSWGVVLYELLTGTQLFRAATSEETITQVLNKEPDFARVPATVRRVLESCLEKDPKQRLRDIGDVSRLLDRVPETPVRSRSKVPWVMCAISGMIAATFAVLWFLRPPQSSPDVRYEITAEDANGIQSFALSPNGRSIVFASRAGGTPQLWLRAFDALRAQPIANTEDAASPFWSPDSQQIGFFAQGALKRISVAGGPAVALCDVAEGGTGSWSRDNLILFSTDRTGSAIQRISASGGVPVDVVKNDFMSRFPQFLPDGRRFVYLMSGGPSSQRGIYLASVDGRENRRIFAEVSSFALSSFALVPNWLLFVHANTLVAMPFDSAAGRVTGDPVPVAGGVAFDVASQNARISVSPGILVYESGRATPNKMQLEWHDRAGKLLGLAAQSAPVYDPAISPDGNFIAYRKIISPSLADLWIWDLREQNEHRLTTDSSINAAPFWSPSGGQIAFVSNRGNGDIYLAAADRPANGDLLLTTTYNKFISDWSRDGRYIVYSEAEPRTREDLWVLPMNGRTPGKPIRFLSSEFDEVLGRLSPDDRWMAYTSDQSGRREVYVRPFPSGDGEWKISLDGGEQPRWRNDGRELYFVRADGTMMAAAVTAAFAPRAEFIAQPPQPLFKTHLVPTLRGVLFQYDVSPDGKRFLLDSTSENSSSAASLAVIVNWVSRLKR